MVYKGKSKSMFSPSPSPLDFSLSSVLTRQATSKDVRLWLDLYCFYLGYGSYLDEPGLDNCFLHEDLGSKVASKVSVSELCIMMTHIMWECNDCATAVTGFICRLYALVFWSSAMLSATDNWTLNSSSVWTGSLTSFLTLGLISWIKEIKTYQRGDGLIICRIYRRESMNIKEGASDFPGSCRQSLIYRFFTSVFLLRTTAWISP